MHLTVFFNFQNRKKNLIHSAFLLLLVAVFLECFFFNYRYWESRFFPSAIPAEIIAGPGIEKVNTDTFRVVDPESAVIELKGIRAPVKNLYLQFPQNVDLSVFSILLHVQATDEGNSAYFELPETEIAKEIQESQYIRLHLSGISENIAVNLKAPVGAEFSTSDLQVNAIRPFWFHPGRVLVVFAFSYLMFLFRPTSRLYQEQLNLTCRNHQAALLLGILMSVFVFLFIGHAFYDPNWKDTNWLANIQYNLLAESLRVGHTWLDIEPPHVLASIPNPYDPAMRNEALQTTGESYIIDFAYRNGRYYCYFGVVPAVLFYLPFLILTGKWLATGSLLIGLSCIFVLAVFWLLYELIRKYYPRTSVGIYLLLTITMLAGCGVFYCIQVPTIYSVPFLCSLLLVAIGLSSWLHAGQPDGRLRKRWLIAGAVSFALTVGCRPTFAIATFLAFPIFWSEIKDGQFFSIKGLKNTLCVILPYLLIVACFLYYNYIRFGSILDFGATYNLTGFDMTHKSIHPNSFWLGFYEYLFQPFYILPRFPFFRMITNADWSISRDYQAQVISEPLMGGFFSFNLIGWFVFCLGNAKEEIKQRKCFGLTIGLLCSGILLISLDIQMVGLTMRYLTEFSFFFLLSAFLIIFALLSQTETNVRLHRVIMSVVVFLCILSVGTNILTMAADGRYNSLSGIWPALYYRLKYWYFAPFGIR